MPAPKRRKVSAASTAKNASSSTGKPRGLDAFTRVSKRNATAKAIPDKTVTSSPDVQVEPVEIGDGAKKRRKSEDEDEESAATSSKTPLVAPDNLSIKHRDIRPLPITRRSNVSQQTPKTPQKPILPHTPTPIEETPSKEACNLFSRFGLAKSSPTQFDSSPLRNEGISIFDDFEDIKSSQISVEPGLPDEEEKKTLPTELLDLIELHASFLNALSLHYAHNGTHTPVDLRELCPAIALSWGKRSVTLGDIRRALGVENSQNFEEPRSSSKSTNSSTLTLSNYGGNKICIELSSVSGKKGAMVRPLDEHHLNTRYTTNLTNLWRLHCQSQSSSKSDPIATFISELPLQPITACLSVDKFSPSLAKGQRRLQDIRTSLTQKKELAAAKKTTATAASSTDQSSESTSTTPKKESALKRSSSLLDRIKAKQAHALTLPPPPSKASLSRAAALHRLEEVISILTLLSTAGSAGQQRVSFTVGTVLGKLRDSMRNPISGEEGKRCLEVLAGEVAPEWVRLVGVGGKGGAVIIDREKRVEGGEVRSRIERALDKGGE